MELKIYSKYKGEKYEIGNKTRKRVYTKRNVGKSDTKDFKWGDEK